MDDDAPRQIEDPNTVLARLASKAASFTDWSEFDDAVERNSLPLAAKILQSRLLEFQLLMIETVTDLGLCMRGMELRQQATETRLFGQPLEASLGPDLQLVTADADEDIR